MADLVGLDSAGLSPWILRSINRYWPGKQKLRLNADELITRALKASEVKEFDEEWSAEAFEVLVRSINADAKLTPLGTFIIRKRLEGALSTRLRALSLFRRFPEILEQDVAPIVLITGLQRTGTTYLQRMLSADPESRALLSWESLDPVPRGRRYEQRKRIRNARLSERALAWMSPGFFAIHPIQHEGPEEDVLLLDPTFYSSAPEAIMHVPEFAEWLEQQDHTVAYEWEAKVLKLLQWQRPASRWILKSPHHLEHLAAFVNVFPDTQIVWTHRDPVECMPSFLSMVYHGRRMFSDRVSVAEVREHWGSKLKFMLSRAMQYRVESSNDIFTDVRFTDIVNDANACVSSIYRSLGLTLTDEARSEISRVVMSHTRDRYGKHKYDLSDFGLTKRDINNKYAEYYQLLNALDA